MRMHNVVVVTTALLLSGGRAAGQEVRHGGIPLQPWYGFDFITGAVDPAVAEDQGTSNRMRGLQFSGNAAVFYVLTVSADLAVAGFGDERSFRENTTEGVKESTVGGGIASLSAGLRTPLLRLERSHGADFSAGVRVGRTWIAANRSITYCMDCSSETVDLRGGTFWEPGAQLFYGRHGGSVRYRVYQRDSDVKNTLSIGYIFRPGRHGTALAPRTSPPEEP